VQQGHKSHSATSVRAARSSADNVDAELRATWRVKREDLESEVHHLEVQSTQLTEETHEVEDAIEGMLTEFEEDKRRVEERHAAAVAHYHSLAKALRARADVCLAAKQHALLRIDASVEAVRQLNVQQEKTQEAIVLATDQCETLERRLSDLQTTEVSRVERLQQLQAEEERMKDASYGLSGEVRELVLDMERLKAEKRKTEVAAMEAEVARRELYSLCEELKGSIRVYCRVKGSVNVDLATAVGSDPIAAVESSSNPVTAAGTTDCESSGSADDVAAPPSPAKLGRSGSVESSLSAGVRSTAGVTVTATSRSVATASNGGFRSGRSTTRSSATTMAAAVDEASVGVAVMRLSEDGDGDAARGLFSFPDRTSTREVNLAAEGGTATATDVLSTTADKLPSPAAASANTAPSLSSSVLRDTTTTDETADAEVEDVSPPYNSGRIITIHQTRSNATSTGISNTQETFTYDRVFPGNAHQGEVYRDVEPLVRNAVDGYRVCIFAYGQTGSGKTFTMEGDLRHSPAAYGVTPRALQTILQRQEELAKEGWSYELSCTFIEIYNDVIRDLFQSGSARYEAAMQQSGNPASYHTIKHCGERTQITNVSEKHIRTMDDFFSLYKHAVDQRSTAKTDLNDKSSRSHCIFTLYVTGTNATIRQRSEGVLCLVDLAGSERVNESGVQGKQFKEAVNINRSLLDLGKCIRALRSGAVVPWRNCKLTYLLQNYLGAKGGKMLMIVTVSNLRQHAPESMNSLRFAARVQETFVGTSVKHVLNMM
jgi:chaperonin cofactor prefoldin